MGKQTADPSLQGLRDYELRPSECGRQLGGLIYWGAGLAVGPEHGSPFLVVGGIPCSALKRWGGAWSCPKLVGQTFLTP